MASSTQGLSEGAFALIDVLGFKGIWRRVSHVNEIVDKLKRVEKYRADIVEKKIGAAANLRLLSLSDSIVICAHFQEPDSQKQLPNRGTLVNLVCISVRELIREFAEGAIPMSIRGCVSYGQFHVEDNFILGPAVDEAAAFHAVPQGAFVWLTPSAARPIVEFNEWLNSEMGQHLCEAAGTILLSGTLKSTWETVQDSQKKKVIAAIAKPIGKLVCESGVIRTKMPIKGGDIIDTLVVNPLGKNPGETKTIIDGMLASMDADSIDVLAKRYNTERFLHEMLKQYDERYEQMAALIRNAKP